MAGITGANAIANWGFESAYKTKATTINKCFGFGVKVTTRELKNNLNSVYGLGSQEPSTLIDGKLEGTATLEFVPSADEPWFIELLTGATLGAPTGTGPYVYTFSTGNSAPSITIQLGLDLDQSGTYETELLLLGCVCTQMQVRADINTAEIRVTLNFVYSTENWSTTSVTAVNPVGAPFNFAMGAFKAPGSGSAIANTQTVDLTINRNAQVIWGIGSRFPTQYIHGKREYRVNTTHLFTNATDYLEYMYGDITTPYTPGITSTEHAAVTLTLDNGGATTLSRIIAINFGASKINSHSSPFTVEEALMETIEIVPRALTNIVVTNGVTTAPTR